MNLKMIKFSESIQTTKTKKKKKESGIATS